MGSAKNSAFSELGRRFIEEGSQHIFTAGVSPAENAVSLKAKNIEVILVWQPGRGFIELACFRRTVY